MFTCLMYGFHLKHFLKWCMFVADNFFQGSDRFVTYKLGKWTNFPLGFVVDKNGWFMVKTLLV